MTKTGTMNFDNVGNPDAVTVPVACKRIRLRQDASVAAPVAYIVHAPAAGDAGFHKYPAEDVVFDAGPFGYFEAGAVPGYIETASGTATFEFICEG